LGYCSSIRVDIDIELIEFAQFVLDFLRDICIIHYIPTW
jgi:hypothetical protein